MSKNSKYSRAKVQHRYRIASEVEGKLNWLANRNDYRGGGSEAARKVLGYIYLNHPELFAFVLKLKEKGL